VTAGSAARSARFVGAFNRIHLRGVEVFVRAVLAKLEG
jgi:hypothetical protein